VRVGGTPPGPLEAVPGAAKQGEVQAGGFTTDAIRADKLKKRSLRRALRRAERHGGTMYKGRLLLPARPTLPIQHPSADNIGRARFGVLSWNCGGLSQLLLHEVKCLLARHPAIKILILQETHHSYQNEWQDGDWTFIHSPARKPKQGGILVGVRADFCEPGTIRWQELAPGRLLHLRCYARNQQHIDILGLYQHALPFGSSEVKAALQKRQTLWNKLDKFLCALPVRSSVVIAGDFNSGLNSVSGSVGFGVVPHSAVPAVAAERQMLTDLVRSHRLCALNTWRKKAPTYVHPSGCSQIDFVLVRDSLADAVAKQCAPWQTPIAGWRKAGHIPLRVSLLLNWQPWKLKHARSAQQRSLYLGKSHAELSHIGALRGEVAGTEVPTEPRQLKPRVVGLDGELVQYWQARKQLRGLGNVAFRDIFARMRLVLQLDKRHRELKALARSRKRRQLLETLELAEAAASKGDSRGLYQCVRWLAPKGASRSIRLRDDTGNLMHPRDECRMLGEYARKLFTARTASDIVNIRLSPLEPELFTPDKWVRALRQLRPGKAVPAGEPAVNTWRAAASFAAPRLSSLAISAFCSSAPSVPVDWASLQFAWLVKAGKSPHTPANLRSIGLMPVDAKALLIVLREAASPPILQAMQDAPQYAYRPGASTSDALLRASAHCASVRSLLEQHQVDHTSKILGHSGAQLVGGLMASLDLRKAFDSVSHKELHLSLRESGVPDNLAGILVQIHAQTRCKVLHGGVVQSFGMSRGLRQGCPIAPVLFAAWTVRLLRLVKQEIKRGGAWQRCTMFADDLHGCWLLHSERDFTAAIEELKLYIGVLERMGMEVNFSKSLIVLKLRGRAVAKACRHCVVWRGGTQHLRLRTGQCDIHIPIESTMPYLGSVLSYENFELRNFQHRASSAQLRFQELRRVLRSQSTFSRPHRLRVYCATVWPALWYSLSSVGVTAVVLRGMISLIAGHLRKVLRIYEEGVTNVEVLRRGGLSPRAFLLDQATRKQQSIAQDSRRSPLLKAKELERAADVLAEITALEVAGSASSSLVSVVASEVASHPCPVCGVYFGSEAGVQQHIAQRHPELNVQARLHFRKDLHSLFGLPFCRFCRKRLHDFNSLAKHVTNGTCDRIKELIAEGLSVDDMMARLNEEDRRSPPVPPQGADSQEAVKSLLDQALVVTNAQLSTQGSKLRVLSHRCALCQQLVGSAGKMKIHWQASHKCEWLRVCDIVKTEARSLLAVFRVPCDFCGSLAKQSADHCTKCPSLFQLLAVRLLHSEGVTALSAQRAPAEKHSKAAAQYKLFRVDQTPIGKHLRFSTNAEDFSSPAKPRISSPPEVEAGSYTRLVASMNDSRDSQAGSSAALDLSQLVLRNPQNYCYLNAVFFALLRCVQSGPVGRALQGVRRLCQVAVDGSRSLMLSSQLQVRAVLRDWTFDDRQHDAAEFASVLFRGLGLVFGRWEGRLPNDSEDARAHLRGLHPIMVPLAQEACSLQDCIFAWHEQAYMHALLEHNDTSFIVLQIPRSSPDGKVDVAISSDRFVQLPYFGDEMQVVWHRFEVCAVVEHHGERITSGHYRAVLRAPGEEWLHTDDNMIAARVAWSGERSELSYLFWLIPAIDPEAPAEPEPPDVAPTSLAC